MHSTATHELDRYITADHREKVFFWKIAACYSICLLKVCHSHPHFLQSKTVWWCLTSLSLSPFKLQRITKQQFSLQLVHLAANTRIGDCESLPSPNCESEATDLLLGSLRNGRVQEVRCQSIKLLLSCGVRAPECKQKESAECSAKFSSPNARRISSLRVSEF